VAYYFLDHPGEWDSNQPPQFSPPL